MLRREAILLIRAPVEGLLFLNTLVKRCKPQFVLGFTFVQPNLRANARRWAEVEFDSLGRFGQPFQHSAE
jgi:hypothetical protein